MTDNLFVLQARILALPSNPDPAMTLTDGGVAHGVAFAHTASSATAKFIRHLRTYHWDTTKILICQQTDPSRAFGHPALERLLAVAMQHGVASEVVPAAFRSNPGPAA